MDGHSILAPAKLNLHLHVTGRRPDGYHLIESMVVFTELGDRLEVWPADELSLSIQGEFASLLRPEMENNLVLRAARLLQAYANGQGAKIVLHKRIPVGAGLGGGSSDAAAAIKGLTKLWKLSFSADQLMKMALSLGSDVPVCLHADSAWITGIGDTITPCKIGVPLWVVLINPGMPLMTEAVYKAFKGTFVGYSIPPSGIKTPNGLIAYLAGSRNMLEAPAIGLLPVIQNVLGDISGTDGCMVARMSGSGATCFGLYKNEKTAQAAIAALEPLYPEAWIKITKLKAYGKAK